MKKIIFILAILLSFHISFGQVPIDTAVNFSVKDIHGNTINLYSILDEGKLVAIDFFSTSCGPCGLYAPDFQASYEDFGENEGNVFFVSICWGDDNAGVAHFDSIYGITHPSVSGSQGGGNIVHNDYQVGSTPTVILINPDREIIEHHIWEPTQANLNDAIIAAGGSMVGIRDNDGYSKDELLVYPNPSGGHVNVMMKSTTNAMVHLEVYNLLGTKVYSTQQHLIMPGEQVLSADLTAFPGGTYFVRAVKEGQSEGLSRLILLD